MITSPKRSVSQFITDIGGVSSPANIQRNNNVIMMSKTMSGHHFDATMMLLLRHVPTGRLVALSMGSQ